MRYTLCRELPALWLQGWAEEQSWAKPWGLSEGGPNPRPGAVFRIREPPPGALSCRWLAL